MYIEQRIQKLENELETLKKALNGSFKLQADMLFNSNFNSHTDTFGNFELSENNQNNLCESCFNTNFSGISCNLSFPPYPNIISSWD